MNQMPMQSPAEIYETYLVAGVHGRWAPLLLERAKPEPGERMLDLACGTGIVARHAAPFLGEEATIIAVDVNADMLEVAERLPAPCGARIEWTRGDACSLPDGPFDLITCQQGLQFFPERLAALREARRVLSPHGRLALNVFRPLGEQSLYEHLFRAIAEHLEIPIDRLAVPYSLGDPADLRELLLAAGYRTVETAPETCTVGFPSPEHFVDLTVSAAAPLLPNLAADGEARRRLVEAVSHRIEDAVDRYSEDGAVSFPMTSNIIVAR